MDYYYLSNAKNVNTSNSNYFLPQIEKKTFTIVKGKNPEIGKEMDDNQDIILNLLEKNGRTNYTLDGNNFGKKTERSRKINLGNSNSLFNPNICKSTKKIDNNFEYNKTTEADEMILNLLSFK